MTLPLLNSTTSKGFPNGTGIRELQEFLSNLSASLIGSVVGAIVGGYAAYRVAQRFNDREYHYRVIATEIDYLAEIEASARELRKRTSVDSQLMFATEVLISKLSPGMKKDDWSRWLQEEKLDQLQIEACNRRLQLQKILYRDRASASAILNEVADLEGWKNGK